MAAHKETPIATYILYALAKTDKGVTNNKNDKPNLQHRQTCKEYLRQNEQSTDRFPPQY